MTPIRPPRLGSVNVGNPRDSTRLDIGLGRNLIHKVHHDAFPYSTQAATPDLRLSASRATARSAPWVNFSACSPCRTVSDTGAPARSSSLLRNPAKPLFWSRVA